MNMGSLHLEMLRAQIRSEPRSVKDAAYWEDQHKRVGYEDLDPELVEVLDARVFEVL